MKLWDLVCKTNPAATKKVNQRGGFTAIDAYSQIEAATHQFGPVGTGWGWSVEWDYSISSVVSADITFWYIHDDKRGEFQVSGGCALSGKPSQDHDAKKKALTDGLTKALSYLGFNADVFLGKFDDNKYLQTVTLEFAQKDPDIIKDIALCASMDDLINVWKTLTPAQHITYEETKNMRKAELEEAA